MRALVTGAARGIGAAIASRLRADGMEVVTLDRDEGCDLRVDLLRGEVAYSASKAGLLGMVKTVAAENVGRGITANAILPGMVATEKVRAMPVEVLERVEAALPARRMAEPDEVAALVAFLASRDAGYITGEVIGIDGGASLNLMSLGSE